MCLKCLLYFNYLLDNIDLENTLTEHNLHSLVEDAASNIPDVHFKAIQSVRKLLASGQNPPIDKIINSKILPILVQCLGKHNK